jgi:hypothetical protein
MPNQITKAELDDAVSDLSLMAYFPVGEDARAALCRALAKMMPSYEALRWSVDRLVAMPIHWPGIGELRGLLCMKYDPADGISATCSLPGYSAAECENRYIEAHERLKAIAARDDAGALARLRLSDGA